MQKKYFSIFLLLIVVCIGFTVNAQTAKSKKHHTGSIYFSWGYNEEWYTNSTIYVKQDALGNDYQLVHVKGQDHLGWDKGIFKQAITIPQYNYRLGYYFNDKQDMGIELNFDHTKYLVSDPQNIHVNGTMNHQPVNGDISFTQANGFYYYLNNGANFFLFNFVRRWGIYRSKHNSFSLDFVGKAGIGPVIPHVQNELYGQANLPHFQLGGWNTGLETVIRATVSRYAFIEFSQKVDYARYSNLTVYEGKAHQAFGTYELILSVGFHIPTTKHNPLFVHQLPAKDKPEDFGGPQEDERERDEDTTPQKDGSGRKVDDKVKVKAL